MTTQHDKAKRWRPWQFSLSVLLVASAMIPILAGVAAGTFGQAAAMSFWIPVGLSIFWFPTIGVVTIIIAAIFLDSRSKQHKR